MNPSRKEVLYASNERSPLDQHAWRVSFDGERTRLTDRTGFHEIQFAPLGGDYVDKFSTLTNPPIMEMCGVDASCTPFWTSRAIDAYGLRAPEQIEVKAQDGTILYGTLLMPAGTSQAASVPLIVNPYGGPDVQTVVNRWSDSLLFDELLAQHGFAVLHADNRGMGRRGRDFAQAAYHNFGSVQLEDLSDELIPYWRSTQNSMRSAWAVGVEAGAALSRCTR